MDSWAILQRVLSRDYVMGPTRVPVKEMYSPQLISYSMSPYYGILCESNLGPLMAARLLPGQVTPGPKASIWEAYNGGAAKRAAPKGGPALDAQCCLSAVYVLLFIWCFLCG